MSMASPFIGQGCRRGFPFYRTAIGCGFPLYRIVVGSLLPLLLDIDDGLLPVSFPGCVVLAGNLDLVCFPSL